jgi:imidazolonepropionase
LVAAVRRADAGAPADLRVRGGPILTMEGDDLGLVAQGGVVLARGGRIVHAGPAPERLALAPGALSIDTGGRLIAPGLVDAHAHPVFAGSRAAEFAMSARGRTYQQIAAAGGGILSTVRATRAGGYGALLDGARARLATMLRHGTTTCEAKSGYALTVDGELRLLSVIRELDALGPVDLVPTLLGAHAVPPELDRAAYLDAVVGEMIPRAAAGGLARFCDAFCEQGAFTVGETRRVLEAARAAGMGLRVHAEQLSRTGGAALAAELHAASADHLEYVTGDDIAALARAGTVATLLPGAALMLKLPPPPARALREAGCKVALGTDCNPGTSMTESLPLAMTLAVTQLGLTVEEAWRAATVWAAEALGLADRGRLAPGTLADLAIFDVDDPAGVPWHYGVPLAWMVIKDGRVAWAAG